MCPFHSDVPTLHCWTHVGPQNKECCICRNHGKWLGVHFCFNFMGHPISFWLSPVIFSGIHDSLIFFEWPMLCSGWITALSYAWTIIAKFRPCVFLAHGSVLRCHERGTDFQWLPEVMGCEGFLMCSISMPRSSARCIKPPNHYF